MFEKGVDTSKQTAPQPQSITTFAKETRSRYIQRLLQVDSKKILAARSDGSVYLYSLSAEGPDDERFKEIRDWTVGTATLPVSKGDKPDSVVELVLASPTLAISVSRLGKLVRYDLESGEYKTVKVKGPLDAFTLHPTLKNVFAVGGEERETELLELDWESVPAETAEAKTDDDASVSPVKSLWQARNVKETRIHLRVPVWIKRIFFLPTTAAEDEARIFKFLVVTRHGQFRIYNSKEGRRPRLDSKLSEHPLNVCERGVGSAANKLYASDTRTSTYVVDMEKLKLLAKLPGGTGAVQALNAFVSEGADDSKDPVIATGGLDRYLRIFDLETRQVEAKVYTGTHITAVLVLEGFAAATTADDKDAPVGSKRGRANGNDNGDDEDEAEADQLWEELDEVSKAQDKQKNKKSKKN